MPVDGSQIFSYVGVLLLLGQPFYLIEPFCKGFSHKAVVGVDEIGVAGLDNPVKADIAQPQSGIRPFLLIGCNGSIVGVNRGEEGEVILYVLSGIEGILGEKDGKLCLYPQGGGQGLVVKLHSFAGNHCIEIGGQNCMCKELILPQKPFVNGIQLYLDSFCVLDGIFGILHGIGA